MQHRNLYQEVEQLNARVLALENLVHMLVTRLDRLTERQCDMPSPTVEDPVIQPHIADKWYPGY